MVKYLKSHENYIKTLLNSQQEGIDWKGIKEYHNTRIEYLQHERLVHLIVTLSFAFFLLISIALSVYTKELVFLLLDMLLFGLLIPYIFHYYKLENGVQRLYVLTKEIENKFMDF